MANGDNLPFGDLDVIPFSAITSEWGDGIGDNLLALASGAGFDDDLSLPASSVDTQAIAPGAVTSPKSAPTLIMETASSSVNGVTSEVDMPGCTATFTPSVASVAIVTGIFDATIASGASNSAFSGLLHVDGVSSTTGVPAVLSSVSVFRSVVIAKWMVSLTASSHTLKLRVLRSSGSGTVNANNAALFIELYNNANATIS